jgi:hypothetical protein
MIGATLEVRACTHQCHHCQSCQEVRDSLECRTGWDCAIIKSAGHMSTLRLECLVHLQKRSTLRALDDKVPVKDVCWVRHCPHSVHRFLQATLQ